jgi:hypothetical protein
MTTDTSDTTPKRARLGSAQLREIQAERRMADEVAHVVAALVMRAGRPLRAGTVAVLAYLVDRAHIAKHGHSVLQGPWITTPEGPVHRMTLVMATGLPRDRGGDWNRLLAVSGTDNDALLSVNPKTVDDDLDLLSVATSRSIDEVVAKYASLEPQAIRDLALIETVRHAHAGADTATPEETGRIITLIDMLVAGGIEPALAAEIAADEESLRRCLDMFDGLVDEGMEPQAAGGIVAKAETLRSETEDAEED